MSGFALLMVSIVFEVTGTSFLAASDGFRRPVPSGLAVLSWLVSVAIFSRALESVSVGAAYAIWSGVGTVLITLVGVVGFRQRLDPPAVLGMLLIIAGVVVMRLFSRIQIG
jgi:small multidrug resistance pump